MCINPRPFLPIKFLVNDEGDTEHTKEALPMILDKIVEDPQSGSCLNISYSDMQVLRLFKMILTSLISVW